MKWTIVTASIREGIHDDILVASIARFLGKTIRAEIRDVCRTPSGAIAWYTRDTFYLAIPRGFPTHASLRRLARALDRLNR